MTRPVSDEELLRRVAARDPAAGAELFDRYAADVHAYLRRQLPAGESDDLLQEVFARALRRASSFRFEASVRTWLRAIARYAVYEHHRRPFAGHTLGTVRSPESGPESLAIRAQERRRLLAALEGLPDAQAIVLELHRVDGLSHDEIARTLGITPVASRKRLERALSALSRELGWEHAPHPRHSKFESWRDSLLRRALPERPS